MKSEKSLLHCCVAISRGRNQIGSGPVMLGDKDGRGPSFSSSVRLFTVNAVLNDYHGIHRKYDQS